MQNVLNIHIPQRGVRLDEILGELWDVPRLDITKITAYTQNTLQRKQLPVATVLCCKFINIFYFETRLISWRNLLIGCCCCEDPVIGSLGLNQTRGRVNLVSGRAGAVLANVCLLANALVQV